MYYIDNNTILKHTIYNTSYLIKINDVTKANTFLYDLIQSHRPNIEYNNMSSFSVCFNDHDKNEPCKYIEYEI